MFGELNSNIVLPVTYQMFDKHLEKDWMDVMAVYYLWQCKLLTL